MILRLVLSVLGLLSCLLVLLVAARCYTSLRRAVPPRAEPEQVRTAQAQQTVTLLQTDPPSSSSVELKPLPEPHNSTQPEGVLNTISKHYAAFYGNPHLSSHMESEEELDREEGGGGVRLSLLNRQEKTFTQPQFTAFNASEHLSSHYLCNEEEEEEDSEAAVAGVGPSQPRLTGEEPGRRTVAFQPRHGFRDIDDTSEDPYAYDDVALSVTQDNYDADAADLIKTISQRI